MPEVSEELIHKIQALLEKTVKNGCTEGEANTAMEHAQKLMDRYGISMSELRSTKPAEACKTEDVHFPFPDDHEVQFCVHYIGKFTNTKTWVFKDVEWHKIVYFGLPPDVSVAKYLTEVFRVALETEWTNYWSMYQYMSPVPMRNARQSFMLGMTKRLCKRIDHLVAMREYRQRISSDDKSLMVLKDNMVAIAFEKLDIDIVETKFEVDKDQIDFVSYRMGDVSGDNVTISSGGLTDKKDENRTQQQQL